jgi:acyl-CoA synthetase (NDP forming)
MKDLQQEFFYSPSIALIGASRTPLGQKATLSHTGSLSGEDPIYDGAFRQAGVVRASDFGEMVDLARVFISQPVLNGKRIGILTTSGSLGAMAADAPLPRRNGAGFLESADDRKSPKGRPRLDEWEKSSSLSAPVEFFPWPPRP